LVTVLTDDVVLVDHHCHGVVAKDLDRPEFEALLTESSTARDPFNSLLGLAVRRWCAPQLELPAHACAEDYLRRRAEWGWQRVSVRLLGAAGVGTWLVDTGTGGLTEPKEFAELTGGTVHEVLRLETVAEAVAAGGVSASGFADAVELALRARISAGVVGLKTVAAYRTGLALPATPPAAEEVRAAAGAWLRWGSRRLDCRVLLGWLVHLGARLGAEYSLPLQFHTGFGDDDLRLRNADPLLLTDFLRTTAKSGVLVVLLHCWPYHRNAGYLAHVFPHVLVDVGLAVPYLGDRSGAVIAELLELAPFDSVCFSSDGYGLPELHHLGAVLWRRGLGRLLDSWIAEDTVTAVDAERILTGFATVNATRAYRI
jgi:uncharacterized protein